MGHKEPHTNGDAGERRLFYVSVASGQVLEDPEAAAYELVIEANDDEVNKLKELFGEYSSMDEAEAFHFVRHPYETDDERALNGGTDAIIHQIYDMLYDLGTDETKQFLHNNRIH
ncbi:hypothetical protein [Paenibacillus xylaniclasticus]|uniref:hypothetical protein n=1 Tax=Paenibacillus xylaniclasticus TaxID=588083 RepID=UPI000FD9CC0C|nr:MULTISPECIES: hypothetical protein [Paenibacillus]GFN33682.1 hypothetical protein PCURB6_39420 [Paenibacillus curdlanolyticus]